jgi:hypothetical protein
MPAIGWVGNGTPLLYDNRIVDNQLTSLCTDLWIRHESPAFDSIKHEVILNHLVFLDTLLKDRPELSPNFGDGRAGQAAAILG